jgi:RNA-directed DNA polymerase
VKQVKVKGIKSPYDRDWTYWTKRMSKGYGGLLSKISKLIKVQKGRCNHCGQYFTSEDLVEIDHIQPKSQGGKDTYSNLQLLHRHCHDVKTRLTVAAPMTGDSKLGAV